MNTSKLKKLAAASAFGVFALLGTSTIANAQDRDDRRNRDRDDDSRVERQKQEDWERRNRQIVVRRQNGTNWYTLQTDADVQPPGRYRVNRNGRWYNTDNRGADILRQAVNEGYRQGFIAGRSDYGSRRRGSWSNSNIYRTGTHGYRSGVDRRQYQYYFQQGFQRGYQDGTNSRYQDGYTGDFQYGRYNNGTANILGTVLNQILNIQSY